MSSDPDPSAPVPDQSVNSEVPDSLSGNLPENAASIEQLKEDPSENGQESSKLPESAASEPSLGELGPEVPPKDSINNRDLPQPPIEEQEEDFDASGEPEPPLDLENEKQEEMPEEMPEENQEVTQEVKVDILDDKQDENLEPSDEQLDEQSAPLDERLEPTEGEAVASENAKSVGAESVPEVKLNDRLDTNLPTISHNSMESTASPRSHAKVENYQIFKKTFEVILASKEAKKNDALKTATQNAIDSLDNSASRDPHVIFEALKLTCETNNPSLKSMAVDLFAKLFDYAVFDDIEDRVRLTDASVDVISACFEGEGTNAEVEMQVVRALMHSILLMPTHGASLLKAVRQIYNVFIFSLTPRNQAVAQGTLTQVIGSIFSRVNEAMSNKLRMSKLSSTFNLKDELDNSGQAESFAESATNGKMTLEKLEKLNGDSADSDRVYEANLASEKDEDLAVKDAFLIFRAMCKLSVKDVDSENVDMRSHSVRSKLLSLHIIHTILKTNIDIFLSKDVVILSSNSDDQTRLIDAVRSYLCQALIRNAASPLAPVFELTVEIFWILISNLRSDFKMEIPVFWEQIYFPVSEMKTSTPHQKRYLLSVIERLCNDSRCIIEFYLNYDCDSSQPNICEKIIDYLNRLALARVDVTVTQKLNYRDNRRKGVSLYDISKTANLTSSAMSSKPPEPEIYTLFPLEYAMKMTSLSCTVAFIRSLYSWAQKGFSTTSKISNGIAKDSAMNSAPLSQTASRNPSFVGNSVPESIDTDDPEQFENLKQRKKAFLEGVRQFSQKPKKGLAYFVEHKFIPSDSPHDVAVFLLNNNALDKAAIGEYLGEGHDRNIAIMHEFVDQMDFNNTSFVEAMRTFLQAFRLPGEGQKIDRFMLKFAERYLLGNPTVFSNADTAYVLAYSTIMLNTDQHSRQVKNRMTVENFIMNNSGIDDGKDVSREFLENIFREIQNNEIKLQSEQHAALLSNDQPVPTGPTGFFGGRDLNKEAYMHASKEMSTKTEKLVKDLGKKMRGEDLSVFYAASHVHHVKSIFDTLWMSMLAGLTAPYKEYDDEDVTNLCLEGIKLSIKIACMFDLQYAKECFIRALVQFQNLNYIEDIKAKNVAAIYIMLEVAVSEGNALQRSWIDVLTSISQLERLQLIAQGVDQDSIPDVSIAKLVNRNSLESLNSAPTGFFLFAKETTASQNAALKFHNQQLSIEGAQLLSRTELGVAMDKVFTNSSELTGGAIKHFVEALSQVATAEIDSSGQSTNPRMFSLQKVVDVCYYNMNRIRLEWSQLWAIMGETFNKVGCNPNIAVSFFALDSLRQLSVRFLDIDELSHFKFQKEFLKPFEYIFMRVDSFEVKDMVLECINNMILAKADHIKSGWKTIFGVLTAAAKERKDSLITKAYKMAFNINKEYQDEVIAQDSFSDLVTCFTEFAKNEKFQKVGLLSLEVLSKLIIQIAKYSIEANKDHTIGVNGKDSVDVNEKLTKLWFPVLFGFFDIIMTGEELEVRSRALAHFFDVLVKYGEHFENDFWDLIFHKLLAPIFGVLSHPWELNYDGGSVHANGSLSERDRMSFWVSTTLIQAMNNLVTLFTHYFDALTPMLGELLTLLTNCVCQENDTIARTGKSCFQAFLVRNASRFSESQWELVTDAFTNLFDLTTAKELFALDPLNTAKSDLDVEALSINEPDVAAKSAYRDDDRFQRAKEKSSIVVKCVLQLLMIETILELSSKEEFYGAIPPQYLMKLAKLLEDSYKFARDFNDNYDLRVRLWNAGVIERLPNLLKQESMSSAVFLNVMFRLYCDEEKATDKKAKSQIMELVMPLCQTIVERYTAFDDSNQQKSISTWRPVIIEIFQGYVELDEDDFLLYSPSMYRLSLSILDRSIGADLRRGLQMFFARIGDSFITSQSQS